MAETTCMRCGSSNRPGRKFCAECGAPLGASCPACGTRNEPGERFCGECGIALAGAAGVAPVERTPAVAVERRLVSVLFADLVGFTPLSEAQDAEEVRELLSRYFELTSAVVGRYGGVVEKFIGDAVMAVWGTPVAQEDDAERAVRAALDLVGGVGDFGRESELPGLAARAAVLTGEAAVTLGAAGQGMVAGDLVNTASRAQGVAEPGTVLVSESTRRATSAAIAYAETGAHQLKGKAEPVPLWRALRVTAGRAGGSKADGSEPPFVGRERELRLAKELFHASADESKAHLLSITGIAGIGKSRLTWELYKYLDGIAQDIAWHRGRCLAYGEGVTYWALAEMVRARAGIADGEDGETARPKLEQMLAAIVPDEDELAWIRPRLAQLLSLEVEQRFERLDLFAGWRLFLERLAERQPVVLAFEDVQWADTALLEFVAHLLEWSRTRPIFVLVLARPELADRHPGWASNLRNTTTLALEPLADAAMEALLDGFVPGLPAGIRGQILTRSEGVPLYAVETVRMLLDRGLLEQFGDGFRPTQPIEVLDVPETLQALVAARLDGLAPAERGLLQDAAVLGKTFTLAALSAVSGRPAEELEAQLAGLLRKEVLLFDADPRSPERGQYGFLQDLLRQVAYDTLPRRERKAKHLAAAQHLERHWLAAEQLEVVEIVASHYVVALEADPKADDAGSVRAHAEEMLVRAAERAAALGAPDGAEHYFERALDLNESTLRRAELHERAGEMAGRADHAEQARTHYEQALAGFDELGLAHPAARVRSRLGLLTWEAGDIEQAIVDLTSAFEVLADDERDADLAELAVTLARPLFFSGRIDEAMARNELALEMAESLVLPEVLAHGLSTKGLILSARGRHEEARLLLQHALDVALEHDLSSAALRAFNNLAATLITRDRIREGLDVCLRGRELGRKVGDRKTEAALGTWILGCLLLLGEWDAALAEERDDLDGLADHFRRFIGAFVPLYRGDVSEARHRVEALRPEVDVNETQNVATFRSVEAEVLLAEGDISQALAAAEEAIGLRDELASGLASVGGALVTAFEAAFIMGDEAKVDELLGLLERTAPGDLTPFLRATGARFGARRAALSSNGAAAAGFAAAADIFRQLEMPFDRALVLLEHAEWLAGENRAEETAALAAEAREIFERLRAVPYIDRLDLLPVEAAITAT